MASLRFPSFATIGRGLQRALIRFPVVLAFVFFVAALGATMVQTHRGSERLFKMAVIAAAMGVLAFAARVRMETRGIHRRLDVAVALGVGALGTLLYWAAPPFAWPQGKVFIAQWAIIVLAALTLAPFSRPREYRGFWRHNYAIFDRAMLAFFFALTAFGGLAIALAAVQGLFGLNVPKELYGHLSVFFFVLFAPWYFLSTYPENVRSLDADASFPGALQTFAQWVIVPLVSIYALILLAYAAHIGVMRTWPKGMVGWLVSWAGALGMAANLILLPLTEKHDLQWLRKFFRAFYAAMIVFSILLAMAAYRRISEYGWTEERVLLALLTLWFFALAIYFTLRPSATRQWIPASLAMIAAISCVGPVSPSKIAQRDQTRRLMKMTDELGLRTGSRVAKAPGKLPAANRRRLWDQLRFFDDRGLLPSVAEPIFPSGKPKAAPVEIADLFERIGQPTEYPWEGYGGAQSWHWRSEGAAVSIAGFDQLVEVNHYGGSASFEIDGVQWSFITHDQGRTFNVEDAQGVAKLHFDLQPWRAKMMKKYGEESWDEKGTAQDSAIEGTSTVGWKGRLYIRNVNLYAEDNATEWSNLTSAWLAFRRANK